MKALFLCHVLCTDYSRLVESASAPVTPAWLRPVHICLHTVAHAAQILPIDSALCDYKSAHFSRTLCCPRRTDDTYGDILLLSGIFMKVTWVYVVQHLACMIFQFNANLTKHSAGVRVFRHISVAKCRVGSSGALQ